MKKFEHLCSEVSIDDIDEELNLQGKKGYEFINVIIINKMMPPSRIVAGMPNMPQQVTTFKLIFKREIVNINDN